MLKPFLVRCLFKPLRWYGSIQAFRNSVLLEDGWIRSLNQGEVVDRMGAPIPWITYPAIDFLSRISAQHLSVFEWGSGQSTRWWCARASRVVACEHDPSWYAKMANVLPGNGVIHHVPLDDTDAYTGFIRKAGSPFDVVVIDGRRRVECAKSCLSGLSSHGVIIWDNTDRPEYLPGIKFLLDAGFHRVDFWGAIPLVPGKSCTSIFFKDVNCLGI